MRRKAWGILITAALLTTSVPMASTVCAEDGFTDGEAFSSQMEKDDWVQGETEDFQDEQSLEENVTEFSVNPEETLIDAGGETDELNNSEYEAGEVRKPSFLTSNHTIVFTTTSYSLIIDTKLLCSLIIFQLLLLVNFRFF